MTRIDELIDTLATARQLPAETVMQCQLRFAEAAPRLRAALERAADGDGLSEAEENLFFRSLHILGASRDAPSFLPLLRLLRRPPDEVDHLLGDAATLTLPRIAVGMFDGDTEALFAAIADSTIDDFVRCGLMSAAAFLAWEGRIDREHFIRFIERFDDERLGGDSELAWVGWQEAIALLGLRALVPRATRAWQDGRISDTILEFKDFLEDLARTERAPDDTGRFDEANLGYLDDLFPALALFTTGRDDEALAKDEASGESDLPWLADALAGDKPAVNPWRHVGRNDPCPCGSGKKAKKCCLAS